MEHEQYPALYKAADCASIDAQSTYLRVIKIHIFLLIIGAGMTINPLPTKEYSLFNAFVFLCALGVSILIATKKYEKSWYSTRAVAESVKTATWRYMMKADPFYEAKSIKDVNSIFRGVLDEILKTNNQIGELLGGEVSSSEQITKNMENNRTSDLNVRKAIYLESRIDEQRNWYALKSAENKRKGSYFLYLLVFLQVLAIICVLLRIAYPEWRVWPTDVFVVGAGGVVTWIQLKRFQEIATAYGLTAHEIGIIRGKLEESDSDIEFSEFVRDAENAFSREHTQWAAKHEL
ncbi:MAG: DUF4231 domain-containing protein [Desulfobacterales bacterium]|nr:DUF4231 domain-containing protein [Desulfobacterales bacterium]